MIKNFKGPKGRTKYWKMKKNIGQGSVPNNIIYLKQSNAKESVLFIARKCPKNLMKCMTPVIICCSKPNVKEKTGKKWVIVALTLVKFKPNQKHKFNMSNKPQHSRND